MLAMENEGQGQRPSWPSEVPSNHGPLVAPLCSCGQPAAQHAVMLEG
jgi:hypothetical protein